MNKKTTHAKALYTWPLFFVVAIIPLILWDHTFTNRLGDFDWYPSVGISSDLFLFGKAAAIILISVLMLLFIALFLKNGKLSKEDGKLWIPLLCYESLVLLSSILSENRIFSFTGAADQFEMVWVLLGYGIILFYSYLVTKQNLSTDKILLYFYIGAALSGLIGISQFLKLDILQIFYKLFQYQFTFEKGRVYGTFYNPNYVGSYIGLLFPIFFVFTFLSRGIKGRIVSAALSIVLFLTLIGSKSATGMVILILSLFLPLFFLRKQIRKHWKVSLFGFVLLIGVLVLLAPTIKRDYISKITNSLKKQEAPPLSSIITEDEFVEIKYQNNILRVKLLVDHTNNNINLEVSDENDAILEPVMNDESHLITLADERFSSFSFQFASLEDLGGIIGVTVTIDGQPWTFTNQTNGSYYFFMNNQKLVKLKESAPLAFFRGHENFASNRGFIWGKTIPLLKDYLLLGSGADTFPIAYPNDDFVDAYNHGYLYTWVTKPHNMYLQIGVQTGVVSLLAFLAMVLLYFFTAAKLLYRSAFDSTESKFALGIFVGIFAYMLIQLFNDSTVCVAPVFFCMLGVGMGLNFRLKSAAAHR